MRCCVFEFPPTFLYVSAMLLCNLNFTMDFVASDNHNGKYLRAIQILAAFMSRLWVGAHCYSSTTLVLDKVTHLRFDPNSSKHDNGMSTQNVHGETEGRKLHRVRCWGHARSCHARF